MFQNCAFATRKLQHGGTHPHVPPDRIEVDVAGAQLKTEGAARAAQQRLYASDKLAHCKRLDEVIVRAAVQSAHALFDSVARRQDQDGDAVVCSSYFCEQFESIAVRQSGLENSSGIGGKCKGLLGLRAQMPDVNDEAGSP